MIVTPLQKIKLPYYNVIVFTLLYLGMPFHAHATAILTTLPPLAGLVQWLDPQARVHCLLSTNGDPHHFQLSPHQIESLQHAKLLLRSSQDDGHWTQLNTQAKILDLWPKNQSSASNHAWLNPHAVASILPKLAKSLTDIDPLHRDAIAARLELALKETDRLWSKWQKAITTRRIHQNGVIMQHPSWRGLFEAMNIPILNILESKQHGSEHGPRKLESALKILRQHPQSLLIADSNHSNRALQWLKKHHSSTAIITLDALGQCGESWTELMRRNIKSLKKI